MQWRLTVDDGFFPSAEELDDSSQTAALARMLIMRVMAVPCVAAPVGHTRVRGIRGGGRGTPFPGIRLFYMAEDGVVTLLRIERDAVHAGRVSSRVVRVEPRSTTR
jgi:hypothetical protein